MEKPESERIAQLLAVIESLVQRNIEQEAFIRDLQGQIKDLQQQLHGKKPPQRPQADRPDPRKKRTGRKPGGQPGHPPHLRQLLPEDRVTRTVTFVLETCRCCQKPLSPTAGPGDPQPIRHQVVELPEIVADVTEYQAHSRTCTGYGTINAATLPSEIRARCVGPRITALSAILSGQLGFSKRNIEEVLNQFLNAPLSLGSIANLDQEVADVLASPYAEVAAAVEAAPVKNVDETGWKQGTGKRWLWVASIRSAALFMIHPHRNFEALLDLVGKTMTGILCTDRWCVFDDWADAGRRQLCWAHLQRNWDAMVERGGVGQPIAEACLRIHQQVFELWHRFREEKINRSLLIDRMQPHVTALQDLINESCDSEDARTARFFKRMLKQSEGLWTFVSVEGVEPTNNSAERALRRRDLASPILRLSKRRGMPLCRTHPHGGRDAEVAKSQHPRLPRPCHRRPPPRPTYTEATRNRVNGHVRI